MRSPVPQSDPCRTALRIVAAAAASVALLASAGFGQSDQAQDLQKMYEYRLEQKQWREAIDTAMEMQRRDPSDGVASYNCARAFALSGDVDNGIRWVFQAIEEGFHSSEMIRNDPGLANIRGEAEFVALLDAADAKRYEQFEELKQEWEQKEILTLVPPGLEPDAIVPLVICLHGLQVDGKDILEAWAHAGVQNSCITMAPDALRPAKGGFSWRFPDENDWVIRRTVERALAEHPIDVSRIILVGFSQGALAAFDYMTAYPHEVYGVVLCSGNYPGRDVVPPTDLEKDLWPRVYITVGGLDVLEDANKNLRGRFERAGYTVRMKTYRDLGHSVAPNPLADLPPILQTLLNL